DTWGRTSAGSCRCSQSARSPERLDAWFTSELATPWPGSPVRSAIPRSSSDSDDSQPARLFCCVEAWLRSWVRASPARSRAWFFASEATPRASSLAVSATWRPLSAAWLPTCFVASLAASVVLDDDEEDGVEDEDTEAPDPGVVDTGLSRPVMSASGSVGSMRWVCAYSLDITSPARLIDV